ncbi:MAG: hypothetical protein ACKO6F_10800 [Cyanobium sp.]
MGNSIVRFRVVLALAAGLGAAAAAGLPHPAGAAPPAHASVVVSTGNAARAVLARAGAESCLRGKLTRALLGLSSSCEREGRRDELCVLADRAAVVTPMTLAFMDETSRTILRMIDPAAVPPSPPATQPSEGP